MAKILGLDLGSTSVGWAVIEKTDEQDYRIDDMGSRIIPLTSDDITQFTTGKAITKNAERTAIRTRRKGYDRRVMRRTMLIHRLEELGLMYGSDLVALPPIALWTLRAKAVTEQLSKPELGRVLLHISHKRGYRSGKGDYADKKQTDFVKQIAERYTVLQEQHKTIGEYFCEQLQADPAFRCKNRVYPRKAYIEEFDRIIECQRKFYPEILTDDVVEELRNRIMFYQRDLKSCKHLVSICEFEKRAYTRPDGTVIYSGPKVAPRTSPLFQVCKIWESINNIVLTNRAGDEFYITSDQKRAIFEFMNNHEKLKLKDLYSILNLKKSDGWHGSKSVGNGLQGNTTLLTIKKALGDMPNSDELLRFNLTETASAVDTETGEAICIIDANFENEPLYRLWHALYSIEDGELLNNTLLQQFGIEDEEVRTQLCRIDFRKAGYGNKSSRAMRRILPYLSQGLHYSDACIAAGFNHSASLTKEENESRPIADHIELLKKNELRQPIVEKILNQMINVVNSLLADKGPFDEIHIELARELKQSREERANTDKMMRDNEKKNDECATRIRDEYHITPTRSRIQKYKLWEESQQCCVYCGSKVNVVEFLNGFDVEVEHVIPRSLLFDDSFSNKVCSCHKCNHEKNNRTAYDYMKSKGEERFQEYIDRINALYNDGRISKTKLGKLLTPGDKIPTDFIERQLRESQYIARKARELLMGVCRDVVSTSGGVTDFIRHLWGWDKVLHNLNIERYQLGDLVEVCDTESGPEQRIKNWNKRMDHRHHAVDALVIACTKRGFIQRINNLNTLRDEPFKRAERQGGEYQHRLSLLEQYIIAQPHFSTAEVCEAAAKIAVSFKSGKRVATPGKRYIYRGGKRITAQTGLIIPRGALSEESVYGCNMRYIKDKKGKVVAENYYAIKYPLSTIKDKKAADSIIDKDIRQRVIDRLEQCGGNANKAFAEPLLDHQGRPIHSVRCDTGLSAVVPVRRDMNGNPMGYVKPGNNHHVAIYEDKDGGLHEHIVTFWHAVERKKYGIPVVIQQTDAVWDAVTPAMPEAFLKQLPEAAGWKLKFTIQQNEMFILGMPEEDYRYAMEHGDNAALCKYLYRVQKIRHMEYYFRYHTETTVDDKYDGTKNEKLSMTMGKFKRTTSIGALVALNPHKVRVTLLGKIVEA